LKNSEKRKQKHYINNKKFYELLCKRKEDPTNKEVLEALGKKFVKLANRIAAKSNFADYQIDIKNEFITDAIYKQYMKIDKFNIETYDNPFAFFTSVVYNVFREHLNRNKKFRELHQTIDSVEMNSGILFSGEAYRDKMDYGKLRQNEINR